MNMKRWLALVLCLAMVFSLAACGSKKEETAEATPEPETATEEPAAEEPEEPAAEEPEEAPEEPEEPEEPAEAASDTETDAPAEEAPEEAESATDAEEAVDELAEEAGEAIVDAAIEAAEEAVEPPMEAPAADITLWTYPIGKWGDEATVKELIAGFNEVYPDINVTVEYLDYTEGDNKVNTAIEGGVAPDLVMEGPERLVANWGAKGLMVDISDIWDEQDAEEVNAAVQAACFNADGALYEYPVVMTAHCMAINYDAFVEAGADQYVDLESHTWTTEQFIEAVKALYEHYGDTVAAVFCKDQGGDQGTRALVNNLYGGTFTNAEHTAYTADDEANAKALELLQGLDGIAFDPGINGGEEIALFYQEVLKMAFCWNIAQQLNPNSAGTGEELTINGQKIEFMSFPSETGESQLCGGIWGFGIFDNGDADKIAAAKAFIKYMADSKEGLTASVKAASYFAVRDTVDGEDISDIWADNAIMAEYTKLMPYLGDYYQVAAGWTEARAEWWNMLQRVGTGGDPAEELATFVTNANAAAGFEAPADEAEPEEAPAEELEAEEEPGTPAEEPEEAAEEPEAPAEEPVAVDAAAAFGGLIAALSNENAGTAYRETGEVEEGMADREAEEPAEGMADREAEEPAEGMADEETEEPEEEAKVNAALVTGPGPALEAPAADITLWTYPIGKWGDEATVKELIAGFNEVYPDINVTVEYLDYTEGDNKVNTAIEGGVAPDLVMEGPERLVANWGAKGLMVDISDIWDEQDAEEVNAAVQAACFNADGALYEYPVVMTAHCMAINYDAFVEAGADQYVDLESHTWTTEQFIEAVKALYEHYGDTVAAVFCKDQGGDQGTRALVNNLYGGTFTNAEHTAYTADDEANAKALELLQGLDGIAFDPGINGGEEIALFYQEVLKMAFCWNIAQQLNPNSAGTGEELTINGQKIEFMSFPSETGESQLCGGIWGFGIFDNGDADKIAAAKAFIKYMADSKEGLTASVKAASYFAVRDTVDGEDISDIWADNAIMAEYTKLMPYLGDYYQVAAGWTEARAEWWNMLQRVGTGGDPAEELAVFAENANAAAAG